VGIVMVSAVETMLETEASVRSRSSGVENRKSLRIDAPR
jgi:hypothetical protein